ncbi:hypothetical protein HYW19_00080 [Candidatus Woesearchaeota archaeon]|nr:hypothetical protein [Candidatus Woesearchaeota archaeon]
MLKKLQIASLVILMMVLIASCAPKSTPPTTKEKNDGVPTTGEAPVDAVAEDISKVGNTDEEIDASELDDVDSILEDIENV